MIQWGQLVRAGDGASNNLIEADNGSSDADFLNTMRTALREARESKRTLRHLFNNHHEHGKTTGCRQEESDKTEDRRLNRQLSIENS